MDAVIVVESCFGSTRAAAEEIARGLREEGVGAVVLAPRQASAEAIAGAGLIVLGAPTHNRGLPTPKSRASAVERGGTAESTGMREWLATTTGARVAAFDTVTGRGWINGSAAKQAVRLARRRDAVVRSFLVRTGSHKGLADGQAALARAWGAELARG